MNINEFKGLKKLAFHVLTHFPEARYKKNILIFRMWEHKTQCSFADFTRAFLSSEFKVESMTRAARAVVMVHPELGNPNRGKLAKEYKFIIKESEGNPAQIEMFGEHDEFMSYLEEASNE